MEGVFVPFTRTPSANRTRVGLCFNLAFFAAVSREDFRVVCSDGRPNDRSCSRYDDRDHHFEVQEGVSDHQGKEESVRCMMHEKEETGRCMFRVCVHSVFMVIEFEARHVWKNDVYAIQSAHHHEDDYDEHGVSRKLYFHDVVRQDR